MNNENRQKLFKLLSIGETWPEDRRELTEMIIEQIEVIEPFIDDIEKQAELRGSVQTYLEILARQCRLIEEVQKTLRALRN